MKEKIHLGSKTWNGGGQSVRFLSNEVIGAVDDRGWFRVFDVSTGQPKFIWHANREQLNDFVLAGTDRYYLGGSYGIVYTLQRTGPGFEVIEAREVLSYIEKMAFAETPGIIATSCFDELCLLPATGENGKVVVNFPKRVRSVEWVAALNAFLTVTSDGIYTVSITGERKAILNMPGRTLAAVFCESHSKLIWFVESNDNKGTLSCASLSDCDSLDWERELILDDRYVGPTTDDYNEAVLRLTQSSQTIVVGADRWVRCFTMDGTDAGAPKRLKGKVVSLDVSPDESRFVAGTVLGTKTLSCWDRNGADVFERTCHSEPVEQLKFSCDDQKIVSRPLGTELLCWEATSGTRLWSRTWEATTSAGMVLNAKNQVCVSIWKGGRHRDQTTDVAILDIVSGRDHASFSVDHDYPLAIESATDASIILFLEGDSETPGIVQVRRNPGGEIDRQFAGTEFKITHSCVSGNMLVGCDQHHLWIWDLSRENARQDFEFPDGTKVLGLAVVDDTNLVLTSESGVFALVPPERRWRKILVFPDPPVAVSVPKAGRIAVCYSQGNAEIRSFPALKVVHEKWVVHKDAEISACALSNAGDKLVTGGMDLHFRQNLYSPRRSSVAGADAGRRVAVEQFSGEDKAEFSSAFWSCAEADHVLDQRSEFLQV